MKKQSVKKCFLFATGVVDIGGEHISSRIFEKNQNGGIRIRSGPEEDNSWKKCRVKKIA
jgi:hypothetical protein